eukprot:3783383-Alexandrium_andersonii.AAC.1
MKSIVLLVYQLPADNPFVETALAATKAYSQRAKEASQAQKEALGPPHPHVWNAWVTQIIKHCEAKNMTEELSKVRQYITAMEGQG